MADINLSAILGAGVLPTGTGFRRLTTGVEDAAVVGETGTGNVMRAISPTTTGTLNAQAVVASGNITGLNLSGTNTGDQTLVGLGGQPLDATLTALAAANWALNSVPLATGADTVAQTTFAINTFLARASTGNLAAKAITDFGLSLVDDADAPTARATLVLGNVENTALSTWGGSANLTTVGTIGTGVWSGTAILPTKGGTGLTTYAAGDLPYASAVNTLAKLPVSTNGFVLTLVAGLPAWAAAASGGVTAVSIAPANGITGTSSGGATPALTIILGAIAPTTIVASGAISSGGLLSSLNGALGTTAGNTLDIFRSYGSVTNGLNLYHRLNRISAGSDWTTAAIDIYRKTDSTEQQFIRFKQDGSSIAFGAGGVESITFTSVGGASFSNNISANSIAAGSSTFTGNLTALQNFVSSTSAVVLSTTGAGTVYLRPNGTGSTTGQVFLNSSGELYTQNAGAVGTQQIIRGMSWNNGVMRWREVLEAGAQYAFYAYDSSGINPTLAMTLSSVVAGVTNRLTLPGEVNCATVIASSTITCAGTLYGSNIAASPSDLTKHISLWGTGYGFSVTGNRLNLVAPATAGVYSVINGVDYLAVTASGAVVTGTLTASNTITSSQNFQSSSAAVVVGTTGVGTVYSRPNGVSSAAGESQLLNNGALRLFPSSSGGLEVYAQAGYGSTSVISSGSNSAYAFFNNATSGELARITAAADTFYIGTGNTAAIRAQFSSTAASITVPTTITGGDLTVDRAGTSGGIIVSTSATIVADIRWATSGSLRWIFRKDGTAETGANAGSDFAISCRTDAGAGLFTALSIVRSTGAVSVYDGVGQSEVGYRKVPITAQNAAYTFVASDSGKCRAHTDTTAYSYTVNTAVHAAGDVLTILNDTGTGAITIVQGASVTLYLAGTTTTGNRTVAVRGMATIFMASGTVGYVSGPGVT